MKRWAIAVSAAAMVMGTGAAVAGPVNLKIGAMQLGTSWYVYGATIAQLIKPHLPQGSNVDVIARGGAVTNPIAVDRGLDDLAISQTVTANWAWNGEPQMFKGQKHRNIRSLVGGLNHVYFGGILSDAYVKRTGNDTLEKALTSNHPPNIVLKPAGSIFPILTDMMLKLYGLDRQKYEAKGARIVQVAPSQIGDIMRDGRADLWLDGLIEGQPTITEIALTTKVHFLGLPAKVIAAFSKKGMKPATVPVMFRGQKEPLKAVDLGTSLIASAKLPDDIAYIITKTIVENKAALVAAHKALKDFIPDQAWTPGNNGIPLHPGAARYYRERGWLK